MVCGLLFVLFCFFFTVEHFRLRSAQGRKRICVYWKLLKHSLPLSQKSVEVAVILLV